MVAEILKIGYGTSFLRRDNFKFYKNETVEGRYEVILPIMFTVSLNCSYCSL